MFCAQHSACIRSAEPYTAFLLSISWYCRRNKVTHSIRIIVWADSRLGCEKRAQYMHAMRCYGMCAVQTCQKLKLLVNLEHLAIGWVDLPWGDLESMCSLGAALHKLTHLHISCSRQEDSGYSCAKFLQYVFPQLTRLEFLKVRSTCSVFPCLPSGMDCLEAGEGARCAYPFLLHPPSDSVSAKCFCRYIFLKWVASFQLWHTPPVGDRIQRL